MEAQPLVTLCKLFYASFGSTNGTLGAGMGIEDVINRPSVQRELSRFRSLGGFVQVDGNTIILQHKIIPLEIVEAFAERLRKLDEQEKIKVVVQNKV